MVFFFFNDTATTEIYTLSLHDALPICVSERHHGYLETVGLPDDQLLALGVDHEDRSRQPLHLGDAGEVASELRSEEHTSELQSRQYLVCRLLLEKKQHTLPLPFISPTH